MDISNYFIEENGNVFSLSKCRNLKHQICNIGYHRVGLILDSGKRRTCSVHRLVALKYIPNPENKPCVNHIDGNKSNNHVNNLEWCTYKENTAHAKDVLKVKFGPQDKKLRNQMILKLSETFTHRQISDVFNCTQANITGIIKRTKKTSTNKQRE